MMHSEGHALFTFALAAFLLQGANVYAQDPCLNATNLNQEWRNINEPIDGTGARCDSQLYKQWYRFTNKGGDDMPVNVPNRTYCGTNFPVWLNGALPTVTEGQVSRSVCLNNVYSDCDSTWLIRVKNCSGYYVYDLPPTPDCPAAYCIGRKQKCSAGWLTNTGYEPCYLNGSTPVFNGNATLSVQVGSGLYFLPKRNKTAQFNIYVFNCTAPTVRDSEGSTNNSTALYRYEWIMRGQVLLDQVIEQRYRNITENELIAGYDQYFADQAILGNNLTCRISVTYKGLDGYYSDTVETSQFLGIQFITTIVTLNGQNDVKPVEMKSTIPFLCQDDLNATCFVTLQTLIPEKPKGTTLSKCQATDYLDDVVFQTNLPSLGCTFPINETSWKKFNIVVRASSSKGYTSSSRQSRWNLRLNVTRNSQQPIWRNYTIGEIPVLFNDNSINGYNPNSRCGAYTDPNMHTFDFKYYQMQQPGEYVMYQHKTLPILVHAYFTPNSVSNPTFSYVCGVAVQSGSDLIVHETCNRNIPKRIRVYGCSDYGLKEEYVGTTIHRITLPTGTKIDMYYGSSLSNNLYIYPTSLDFKQTSGLCGTFDGNSANDMVLKDGSYSKTSDFSDFAASWRVLTNKSSLYFGQSLTTLSSWTQREEHYCVCRAGNEAPSCSYTSNNDASNCAVYNAPTKDPNYSACIEYKKRSTESTDNVEYEEPTEFPEAFNTIINVNTTWKNGWDEVKASNFCTDYIKSTAQFSTCSGFEDVDLKNTIDTCVSDIQISGQTVFTDDHKNIMLTACENIFQNNQSLWTMNNETGIAEPPQILAMFCPADCSGHGICTNGNCVCDPGYTDTDCAGNLTHVPVLFPLPTNGLCDTRERACLSTPIFADHFAYTTNISCQLQEFVVKDIGKLSTSFVSTTSGIFYHDQKVACTLPTVQSNLTGNTLGYGFKVSVANTANAYSTPQDLVVYDSNCVTCSTDQVCQPKKGYCVIEGVCYNDQELKWGTTYLKCDSSINQYIWTTFNNGSEQPPTKSSTSSRKTNVLLYTVLLFLSARW